MPIWNINRNQLLVFLFTAMSFFVYCQSNKEVLTAEVSPYLNLHDSVKYVGMETCRSCHQEIYETFRQTGMGQSFDHATPAKTSATFHPHTLIYDSIGNYYYHPYWRHDSLFIKEFRLNEKRDTIHQREQYVRYIVGSGQHTNSHIFEENDYLYQAPITFYTQKGIWDLAPGFEGGFSSRFQRIIGQECMTCHNSLPNFVEGSENKFLHVPSGISCERCHGPGELHVKERLTGKVVDTSKYADFTIVNPRRLPRHLQMSLCQRCHLQGVAILEEGKKFEDFKPGMHLQEVMNVFLPEFDGHQTQFIMASHAHRMQKSLCYQKSNMTCITCHNPHISVKHTARELFNSPCQNCHQPADSLQISCTLPENQRISKNKNDCSGCHMPLSGSIDIPHVTIHDHFIRKPIPEDEQHQVENFIGLSCVNNPDADALTRAKAMLHYYESYSANPILLDSATHYLKVTKAGRLKCLEPQVHLHYLKNEFHHIIQTINDLHISNIKDGWTAYRIGEAYLQKKQYIQAENYFAHALKFLPLNLDFLHKLGVAYMQQNKITAAKMTFEQVLAENETYVPALSNLGFVYVNLGDLSKAEAFYQQALALNPDYESALLNMAGLHLMLKEKEAAKKVVRHVLQKNPQNAQAQAIMQQLQKGL